VLANSIPKFLLASPDPAILTALEPPLAASGSRVQVALSADAALAALAAPQPPALALLDVNLPGMEMGRLLAAVRTEQDGQRIPIVLISDTVTQEWIDRLAESVIDDLLPRSIDPAFVRLRLETVLRTHQMASELERARVAAAMNTQVDRLTGIYNREAMMGMLFRETDRVQRMNSPLCLVLFDIDDFGHWNSRLGAQLCDELLCQVAARTTHLLRSYDLLGRAGKDEFLVATPGCGNANAVMLAERLRQEVFSVAFRLQGESIRLSACFGIASTTGERPLLVLREAEQALACAKEDGPESIQCFGESAQPVPAPVTFLSSSSGDELLAW
jgi:diguanylate cyclase (GGDEF)-like protein